MSRNIKALGLALVVAFAFSAIGAQAASADLFKSPGNASTIVTSEKDTLHVFSYSIGAVECDVAQFSGTQNGEEATSITVTPTYDECMFNETHATVRTNHCGYLFTSHTVEGDAPVHVECLNEGEHIEVELPTLDHCTLTIAPQTTGGGVTYKNEGSGSTADVTVKTTATVTVTRDNPGPNFFCSLVAESGTGTYTGTSTLKGYKDNGTPTTENETITWVGDGTATTSNRGNTHWDWTLKEGAQVGIEVEST